MPTIKTKVTSKPDVARLNDYSIKTSTTSVRKYPKVIWFPRSKTDPREIREVLKLALAAQEDSKERVFNDKILGQKMASVGSISVVGLGGAKYIESYQGKSIGDISYITNARMVMRLLRFLGLVSRVTKGKYRVTELGRLYAMFSGDFPAVFTGESEEVILLQSLSDFSFYSVNDDSVYRNPYFKVRPFIILLKTLAIESQCIYQLIVTALASTDESSVNTERMASILANLRDGSSTVAAEWRKLELNPDDYSCVHNFYDSVKILVYLGSSLGLITKFDDPKYGRIIIGKAKNLTRANTFYRLTHKGEAYLRKVSNRPPVYYEDLFNVFGDSSILESAFILGSLNFQIGKMRVRSIEASYLSSLLGISLGDLEDLISVLSVKFARIELKGVEYSLSAQVTFNFWQSIPPEILNVEKFKKWYEAFIKTVLHGENSHFVHLIFDPVVDKFEGEVESRFILNDEKSILYATPDLSDEGSHQYVKYAGKEEVFGGADRFPSRISPTKSVTLVKGKVHIDNERDALDLLVPLRFPDEALRKFINSNISELVHNFINKSDTWEKDQHYTWVRNCFRQLGSEALFSGSGGMLSRADVSIISPFLGGIESKSPRENRGTINLKAVRQAVDAKIQVADGNPEKDGLPRAAIAIGRRISSLAIKEEKKWAREGQPVLLMSDAILYYLTLRSIEFKYIKEDIVTLFTKHAGVLTKEVLMNFFETIFERENTVQSRRDKIKTEIDNLTPFLTVDS